MNFIARTIIINKSSFTAIILKQLIIKKTILFILSAFIFCSTFAQTPGTPSDKIYKHSGEVLDVNVIKVGETTITYKYPGEDAEQVIGKLAVDKIVYAGSGRTEEISDKIEIENKDDWEKVQIITDPAQIFLKSYSSPLNLFQNKISIYS